MKKNSTFTLFVTAVIITIGILAISWNVSKTLPRKCVYSICRNDAKPGSSYCDQHPIAYKKVPTSYHYENTTKAVSKKSTTKDNSISSSSNKTYKSKSSKSKSSAYNSVKSYDKGYDDVYEDDDYDWDRYWSDSDYADGVDDAMDDLDW